MSARIDELVAELNAASFEYEQIVEAIDAAQAAKDEADATISDLADRKAEAFARVEDVRAQWVTLIDQLAAEAQA